MKKQLLSVTMATALTLPVWLTAAYPDGGQVAQAATKQPTKKAKSVINKIKAIDSKKTNYIAKVRAANNAYKKLSAKDRKLVSNYKTLKKHLTKIAPLEKKITTLKTQVSKITDKNYTTTAPKAQSTYKAMNAVTKAAVPAATVKKLNQYATSAAARTQFSSVVKLLAVADEDGNVEEEVADSTGGVVDDGGDYVESKTELAKQLKDFLITYKTLDTFQKSLFTEDETTLIQNYLVDEAKINDTVAIVTAYEKLQPSNNGYAAKAFEVALLYNDFMKEFEMETPDEYFDEAIYTAVALLLEKNQEPITKINEFEEAVTAMKNDLRLGMIYEAEQKYNELISPSNKFNLSKYADKDLLKTYQAYAKVPVVLKDVSKLLAYEDVTADAPVPSKQELNKIKDAQTAFKGLGKEQQAFTLALANDGTDTSSDYDLDIDVAIANLPFTQEAAEVKEAEKLDSSYTKAYNSSDLEGMISASIEYGRALPNVQKYSLYSEEIKSVNETYAEQIEDIKDFEARLKKLNELDGLTDATADQILAEIEDLQSAYKALEEKKRENPGKPAAVDMLSKPTMKDYELYMTMPGLIRSGLVLASDLEKKPYDPDTAELRVEEKDFKYNANDEQRIVEFAKIFNKLTEPQKTLVAMSIDVQRVDETTPIARIWGTEAALVSQAQKLDAQILKLNTGSKKFAADVKKAYNDYKSAPPKVKKYVINQERLHWFNGLVSKTSGNYPQAISNTFQKYVSKLNASSAVTEEKTTGNATPIVTAVTYYDEMIEHDTSTQSIIGKTVMTKYNKYLNAYNVYNLLMASDLKNPNTQDIKNIQQAIALYDKLEASPRKALMNTVKGADTDIAKVLSEVDDIKTATTIDKDYQKLKPSSDTYKVDMIKLYTTFSNASDTVRKYVAAKDDLKKIETDYAKEYKASLDFKARVDALTSASNMEDVNNLKEYYEANVESNEIIKAFIPKDTMSDFEKFMYLIDVQDVARYNYFYNYWCSTDDILSYDYLYVSLSQEDLVKVFKKYNKMDAEQKGIIAATPHKTDIEEASPGACYIPGKDAASQKAEKKVMRDTSFLASAQYVDEANKIDKMYEALNPKDKDYLQKVMEVVNAYNNANSYTKPFVKNAENILKLQKKYEADFKALEKMEDIIKSLSADSQIAPDPAEDFVKDNQGVYTKSASINKAYDAYNRLPEYIQPVISDDLKKKYNEYILLLDVQVPELRSDTDQPTDPAIDRPADFTPYTPNEITQIKNALATYKKLGTIQKTIALKDDTLNNGESPVGTKEALKTYIDQEKYYKEANTLDASYDKFVKKYGTEPYIDADPVNTRPPLIGKDAKTYAQELKKLVLAYDKLSNNAVWYVQNIVGLDKQKESFDAAYSPVYDFEQAVALINSTSTLSDIDGLKSTYEELSDYQKAWIDSKVLARYNELVPTLTIRDNLKELPPFVDDPDDVIDPSDFTDAESTALKEAVSLYGKLPADVKSIFDKEDVENKEYLSEEYDILVAEKTDKLIASTNPGSTFFKSYVNARKSYDALTKKQKQYLKQKSKLAKYDKAVDKVQYTYTFNGDAKISYKDQSSYNPYEMIIMFEELIDYLDENQAGQTTDTREAYLKDAADMVNIRNALNKSVKINGVSLKPLGAADGKKQARYYYYYTVFDMKNKLKNFNKVFPK